MDVVILALNLLAVVVGAAVEAIAEAVAIAVHDLLLLGRTAVQRVPATAGAQAEALHHQREGSGAHPLMKAEAQVLERRRNVGKRSEKVLITVKAQGERLAGALQVQKGRDPQLVKGTEAQRLMGGARLLEMMMMELIMSLQGAANPLGTKKLGSYDQNLF